MVPKFFFLKLRFFLFTDNYLKTHLLLLKCLFSMVNVSLVFLMIYDRWKSSKGKKK